MLLHVAQIHELKTGKPDRAIDALRQVLELDHEQRAALMGLRRLYRGAGELELLQGVLERLAELATGKEGRVELWREVRDVAAERGDDEGVIDACGRCLELDADDDEAAEHLLTLFERHGRHEELVALLERQADRAESAAGIAAIRVRVGRLRESALDDPDGAVDEYSEAWERDPECVEAFDALARLHRERESWDELYPLLAGRAEALGPAPESVALWLEVAGLADRRLDDPGEAMRAYQRALDADDACQPALDALTRSFEASGRLDDLAELHIHKARLADDPAERARWTLQAAALYADELGEPDEAEPLLDEILADTPDHAGAARVLGRMRVAQGRYEEAAALLEGLGQRLQGEERVDTLVVLGRLYGEHLERPDDALRTLMAARELDPEHEGVATTLRDLFQVTGSWEELAQIFQSEFDAATAPGERCDRALALARLHLEQRGDEAAFLHWTGKAQEARRDSRQVVEALIAFYGERERWDEVAPRLEWLVSYLDGKKLVRELPRRAHELGLLLERLEQPAKALEYYKMAMNADGTYLDNVVDYGRLLVAEAQWDKALRVHQNLLTQRHKLPDDDARSQVLYHLARACHELGQTPKARQYLRRLLAKTPDHEAGLALQAEVG